METTGAMRAKDAKSWLQPLQFVGMAINFIFVAAFVLVLVFLLTMAIGLLNGYVLPNTAVFHLFWPAAKLALLEPYVGHLVLILALVGAVCSWLSSLNATAQEAFEAIERRLALGFRRFGLIALIGVLLFSIGATWAGIPRKQDLSVSALAGLIPFSDANLHFLGPSLQSMYGSWEPFIERRALAAAFRTILVVASGFNNYHFLMLQAVAVAVASYFAIAAVTAWRGVWAGMTFFGLIFIAARPYLPTNLTEPLAMLWAVASVPFIVRALRTNDLPQGAMALHTTCWALLIRMGSMFTLPALGLWIIVGQSGSRRRWIVGVSVVLGVLLVNVLLLAGLQKLYGTERGMAGSNFSYVICGLAQGTDWSGCAKSYHDELMALDGEAEQSKFLYERAFQKFMAEPKLLLKRLWDGETFFLTGVFDVVLGGYVGRTIPSFFPTRLWTIFASLGIFWSLLRSRERRELSFWLLILGSIAISAPFVIFDDGWRTLCTTFVLLALFIASGFRAPTALSVKDPLRPSQSSALISIGLSISTALLCVLLPGLDYKLDVLGSKLYAGEQVGDDEDIFLGAEHMSGFVILPDGAPPLRAVPSMPYEAFSELIRTSGHEQNEPLITPSPTVVAPFALLSGISVKKKQLVLLVAPPEMMTRVDVPAWKVRYTSGPLWRRVVETAPINR